MNSITKERVAARDEGQLQLLLASITDYAIYMLNADGFIVSWNTGAQRFKGYTEDEIIGEHFSRFYTEEDRATGLPARALRTAREQGKFEGEGWRVRKDGTRFWAHVVIDAIRAADGTILGFAKITRDVSERKKAEDALRLSEQRFRMLVKGVTDYAIYMLDPDGFITNWNAGAQRFKGYNEDEVIGEHFSRFYTEEDRATGLPARALRTAREQGKFEGEGWRVRKDGTRFWAHVVLDAIHDDTGTLIGFAKITRDITERKKAQEALAQAREALFQSQKMEAVGQLTGGIAHDFNNLLTIIVNNLDLLTRSARDPRDIRLIESAQRAADRGAKLTQQLLAFSRRQPLQPEINNPNNLVRGFEPVLRRACGETVDFQIVLDPRLRAASIDGPQFETALLNLVINARDAMTDGGSLRIQTRNVVIREEDGQRKQMKPGDYVEISVSDTGSGMAPEDAARAFEPFFTTKEVGKGTGLGLSMVYGFVKQSGGHIEIDTALGKGTTVVMLLPAQESDEERQEETTDEREIRETAGTVLIVEDEPEVLEIASEIFDSLGYEVLTATDAIAALDVLKGDAHIDVLFSDVVMPRGMSGLELAKETRRLRPDVKILLASGYPVSTLPTQGLPEGASFISKPYRWTELADKLRGLRAKG
ncbi:hybrid sensor histidine kinase/response regulator [Microvirga thermotolerans]|uniref:histidine kinase n=1 Tax=Microvirga thermotolerans TaxID=2651334 RepID=A0A5P9JUL3_9HYPH|nr:PAS domain-containing sensor histidine kinase [Microvirga thermotolerans]QFU15869.1 PAS domain S-box protein [Microvirga thermotolerans]